MWALHSRRPPSLTRSLRDPTRSRTVLSRLVVRGAAGWALGLFSLGANPDRTADASSASARNDPRSDFTDPDAGPDCGPAPRTHTRSREKSTAVFTSGGSVRDIYAFNRNTQISTCCVLVHAPRDPRRPSPREWPRDAMHTRARATRGSHEVDETARPVSGQQP